MTSKTEGRAQLTLLGGFLGSGKTTWLRHQLHGGAMADALVIVNEAADVPVDNMLLFKSSEIRILAGGCACCSGRDNLVRMLREFCNNRVDAGYTGRRFDHIVLETSGLADPGPIVDAIRNDPVLQHHIVVSEIIAIVDALHGLSYLASEPLGRRQVETADQVIVAKVDAVGDDALKRLLATLKTLNPGAAQSGSVMGSPAPLPDFAGVAGETLPSHNSIDDTPVLSTVMALDTDADWTAFGVWLSALLHARGDDIIRVKGVVRTPLGRLLLQTVRKVVQAPEILPDQVTAGKDDNRIVFIGKNFRPEDLKLSVARFTATEITPLDEPGSDGI